MTKILRDGRRTFYLKQEGDILFVGTEAFFSIPSAQLIIHHAMRKSGLLFSGYYMDFGEGDMGDIIACGYQLPKMFKKLSIWKVKRILKNYTRDLELNS